MKDADRIQLLLDDGYKLYNVLEMILKRSDGSFHIDAYTMGRIIRDAMNNWQYSVREVEQNCKSIEEIYDNPNRSG